MARPTPTGADTVVTNRTTVNAEVAQSITYGSAAPTTGTAVRGDIVFNSAAAVGQPFGWICTAAGTPGTWRALANVA